MTARSDDIFRPVPPWRALGWTVAKAAVPCIAAAGLWFWHADASRPNADARATVAAERRVFTHTLHRAGVILPLNEERIFTKLEGTILEIAAEGSMAKKDDIVLQLDPRPNEDLKAEHEESIAEQNADFSKTREESMKVLNLAREDVKSYDLRLKLEQLRLDEIKKGPTPTDEVNAVMNLENNKIILTAKQEELAAIEGLAKLGYSSIEELRQTQQETVEQHFKVLQMDIAHRKLNIVDPVKVADQEVKVKEALKTRDSAKQKVELIEGHMKHDDDRHWVKRHRDEERLVELNDNIAKTRYRAPCAGLVVPRRAYYGFRFAPGREVYDGMEVLTIPDLSKMKVKLSVDEGHVSRLSLKMKAQVTPAGWTGKPFEGVVINISEQGRDEFEQFQEDTTAISGTANRKVFDVEVELKDHSPILRMGLRCDVDIVLNRIEKAIVVPRAALITQKDGDIYAPIAERDGTTTKRKVKLTDESELWAAVEGVSAGERIVLN